MAVWINEFHYDNTGFDSGEFIELAGTAGTSLSGWQVVRYNGNVPSAAVVYTSPGTITLGGTLPNQSNGYGTLSFTLPQDGLQNGPNDGFALVDNTGAVVQLLSYEGVFTASNGPAAGLTSTDIGLSETGFDPVGGSSLALTGTGTQYSDFTWTKVTSPTSGAINGNEFFAGSTASLSISDASVTEGNGGTALLTFTVTRSDASTAFTVHYATADGTATAASGDYVAQSGDLTFTAGGALSQTISVVVNGDTVAEPDETLTVALSGLVNQTGTTAISDGSGLGTIRNDDVALTAIYDIQGEGHKSPFIGGAVGSFGNSGTVRVSTEGVVTAIASNGFYLQDATGDGKDATSDGIFVFTGGAPAATITVGETVRVLNVRVDEFRPGGSGGSNNLTITELNASVSGASIQEMGGHTEIAPVLLGPGGREIPQGAISSNGFATYDPATYAIDFWETLEGMLVKVPSPVTVSATNEFRTSDPANPQNAEGPPNEEIWVVPAGGYDAASQTARGGLIIGPTDYNPERIQIDDINPALDLPNDNVGTHLSDVTGVVNYDFANYEVLVSQAPTVTQESTIQPETTALTAGFRQVTIGDYNVQNLDPVVENTSAWGTGGVAADGTGGVTGSTSGNASGTLYGRLGNSDDDVGNGHYALVAQHIAQNMGAPTIVSLQEVQDSDGATISSVIDSDVTLKTLTDLIEAQYGIHYAFAYINPPGYNINGGQPNGNIRQAFLYQPDQVTLDGLVQLTDPNPGESDLFAGDDFANSRKPLVGEFSRNGVHFYVINNHFDSKGGDNALFGNAQPPVLSSELQRIEQAKIVHDYVAQLLAADPTAKIVVNGDLNDFSWSNPLQTLEGVPQGSQILFDLGDSLLPVNERYSYNYDGNTQELDHQLASSTLLNGAGAAYDIVHVNSEFATQASDHDPSVARFDFTGFSETLTLTDAAETVDGGAGDDTVLGMGGNDSLAGGSGADSLDGGTGADTLTGGTGSDTYVVDQAGDLVIEQPGEGTDTVRSGVTYTLGADVENLVLTGGRTSGTGNALDNDLAGSGKGNALAGLDGADTLNGGGGDDTLTGGLGADQLTGGKGADLFYYGSAAEGGDTILDFKGGTDAIGVSAAGFGGGLFAGEDLGMTGRFTSNRDGHATASDGTGQFVFATATKALYWDEDGQGTGEAVLIATIGKTLAASDIHVLA